MRPFYPDVCIMVDIADHIGKEDISSIGFGFKNLTSYGVKIYIEDKNLVTSRPVKIIFVQEDVSKNCKNYHNKE